MPALKTLTVVLALFWAFGSVCMVYTNQVTFGPHTEIMVHQGGVRMDFVSDWVTDKNASATKFGFNHANIAGVEWLPRVHWWHLGASSASVDAYLPLWVPLALCAGATLWLSRRPAGRPVRGISTLKEATSPAPPAVSR